MPFAIYVNNSAGKHEPGVRDAKGFLRVSRNSVFTWGQGSGRKRELVHDLDDATTWAKIGHAKSALCQAVESGAVKASAQCSVVTLRYTAAKYQPVVIEGTKHRRKIVDKKR